MNITYGNTISIADYNNLRNSAGWKKAPERLAESGIENSSFLVSANIDNRTVGMARVLSDGGYVSFILDVVVLPEYQRQGIGKTMMKIKVFHQVNCFVIHSANIVQPPKFADWRHGGYYDFICIQKD